MTEPYPQPSRPVLAAQVERLAALAAQGEPSARLEMAHATALALVEAGRDDDGSRTGYLVALADTIGLETLAELWHGVSADTLPGALWALYVIRSWCQTQGELVGRLYRGGRGLAPIDEVVAGVADDADPRALCRFADDVLAGAYRGDFAVALERAAAFFRVVAAGRRELAEPGPDDRVLADRNDLCARRLAKAATAWRRGGLR